MSKAGERGPVRRESTPPQPKLPKSPPPGVCMNERGGSFAPAVPGVTLGINEEGEVERALLPPAVIVPSVGLEGPGPENDCSNGFGS